MADFSIWGKGDELTLKVLQKTPIKGVWIALAAGDGRYVHHLLERAEKVVVSDCDGGQLERLKSSLSEKEMSRTEARLFDLTSRFPFNSETFDGVLCTGTLHLFEKERLPSIFSEIGRVLKPEGIIILDFATDIKRGPEKKEKALYTREKAKKLLNSLLEGYSVKVYESTFEDDLTRVPGYGFKTRGKFLLIVAKKK